jgi:anti-sigma regulatory factor (Ser/Thr protein kinase)
VHRGSDLSESPRFEKPQVFLRRFRADAAIPASDPVHVRSIGDLSGIRAQLARVAHGVGLPLAKQQDICLAANEVLTNALVYGEGPVEMWTYIDDGYLIVEVRDHGRGIEDPLVGYEPPPTYKTGGRGVWLARQVLDLLEIVPTPEGTVAKLYLRV